MTLARRNEWKAYKVKVEEIMQNVEQEDKI